MGQKLLFSTAFALVLLASTAKSLVLDVTTYAKGNADITQGLSAAFKEACASTNSSKVLIPKGTYTLMELILEGPCKGPVEIQVDGTLNAPVELSQMKTDGWVTFQHVDQFTLSGAGTFHAQGKNSWAKNDCTKNAKCSMLPVSLRFNFVTNGLVKDITSIDSKNFHINVLGCQNLTFQHLTITAPGDSPNTDGIHIGKSTGINIVDTNIKTGDDCISIGDGSQQVNITKVTCGPGHGISIGSLGKYPGEQPVAGISVKSCTLIGTQNGVRIKTWPASPAGSATDMHFEDITLDNVGNPILIDQVYCPWNQCKAQMPSLVKISKVSFKNIRGTSSTQVAVKLACSSQFPCDGVEVSDIDIAYHGAEGPATSICSNVKPTISGTQNPNICSNTTASSHAQ